MAEFWSKIVIVITILNNAEYGKNTPNIVNNIGDNIFENIKYNWTIIKSERNSCNALFAILGWLKIVLKIIANGVLQIELRYHTIIRTPILVFWINNTLATIITPIVGIIAIQN